LCVRGSLGEPELLCSYSEVTGLNCPALLLSLTGLREPESCWPVPDLRGPVFDSVRMLRGPECRAALPSRLSKSVLSGDTGLRGPDTCPRLSTLRTRSKPSGLRKSESFLRRDSSTDWLRGPEDCLCLSRLCSLACCSLWWWWELRESEDCLL
jgi:hypothetical protein